jgi:hypothetical protein
MNSIATLMLVRAMEEERRRHVKPRRITEPEPDMEISKPRSRSWTAILSFPRVQLSKG